jgi:uncharacterized protein (DUF927 family)
MRTSLDGAARGAEWIDQHQGTLFDEGASGPASLEEQAAAMLGDSGKPSKRKPKSIRKDGCAYGGGQFIVNEKGVLFVEGEEGDEKETWLCSPVHVIAETRDNRGNAWGRLLRWNDLDRTPHQWAMPMELLGGDNSEVFRELLRQGVRIAAGRKAKELLIAYLQVWKCDKRARCVERMGWHDGVYALPDKTLGQTDEIIVFQNPHPTEAALLQAGTLEGWRDTVAKLAAGNSRLVFALSVAFAAALAELAGEASGGFHLRGASSTGKSTALRLAASVWGCPDKYPRLWRATSNGVEGLAALHNDGLLILDELAQCDPCQAGEVAYMLGNGQGKTRANRTGAAREAARWRLLFLSAGEQSLSELMARAGHKTLAG